MKIEIGQQLLNQKLTLLRHIQGCESAAAVCQLYKTYGFLQVLMQYNHATSFDGAINGRPKFKIHIAGKPEWQTSIQDLFKGKDDLNFHSSLHDLIQTTKVCHVKETNS